MSHSINANISHAFYYTSASYENSEDFAGKVRNLFPYSVQYDLSMETDDAYIKDMQTAERFLHGGGQTYRVCRFFINDLCPDLEAAGFSGWCVLLSYFEESDIISISFHYSLSDTTADKVIAIRQSGVNKKYKFADETYSCSELAEKMRVALGLSEHVEISYLCEITKLGDYTDIDVLEKEEPGLLYGILSGDEGYEFVPEHLVQERLESSWGSRDFIRIYASRQAFLFLNLLNTPRHEAYLKRQTQFGTQIYGGCDPYFYMGECPLTVNHGILFSVEFVMMLKALINEVLTFQTEHSKKKFSSYYRRISATRELRRKIIKVLEKVERTEISEIGELSAMLLVSQHIAPIVDQVKYLLELLEGDLTLVYSERNNLLVTILTVLGLLLAFWQILLAF
ncbi:MAG: hypothetical protein E7402_03465 [Ruminococcaceae bacterium]|nr:hypothetical protein [Oscillospiraceae bacterium]